MKTSAVRSVWAIGRVTFLEVLRDRVLYNILVVAVLLIGVSFLASRLSFLRPDRVILNFGLSAVTLSSGALAILAGAALLGREFERRTLYVALSHPISRAQFVVGKFIGLAQVLALNWALISLGYLVILAFASYEGLAAHWSPTLAVALALALLQSWVLGALAVFFSTFSTTSLSVMMTAGIYVIGINSSQLRLLASQPDSSALAPLLNTLSTVVPNFENFNLGLKVTYGLPVSVQYVGYACIYGVSVLVALLLAAGWLVRGREL